MPQVAAQREHVEVVTQQTADAHAKIEEDELAHEQERLHKIDSTVRNAVFKMLLGSKRGTFMAWALWLKRKKRNRMVIEHMLSRMQSRGLGRWLRAWIGAYHDGVRRNQRELNEELLKRLKAFEDAQVGEDELRELYEALAATKEQTESELDEHSATVQRLGKRLGYTVPAMSGETDDPGYVEALQDTVAELAKMCDVGSLPQIMERRRRAAIESRIRSKVFQKERKAMQDAFDAWVRSFREMKRHVRMLMKSHSLAERHVMAHAWARWTAHNDRSLRGKLSSGILRISEEMRAKLNEALNPVVAQVDLMERRHDPEMAQRLKQALEERLEAARLEEQEKRDEAHRLRVERTVRKATGRLLNRTKGMAFAGWRQGVKYRKRVRNLCDKIAHRVRDFKMDTAFSPWLMAARAQLTLHADEKHREGEQRDEQMMLRISEHMDEFSGFKEEARVALQHVLQHRAAWRARATAHSLAAPAAGAALWR